MDHNEQMLRNYLRDYKGMNDHNIDFFIKEYKTLTDLEKSDLIYEIVGKEIYKENPVPIDTFIEDPYFMGDIYGGILFKIWRDLLHEIYPAPFCKKYDEVILSVATRCFGKGTKILMFDGSVKNIEDIVVGDKVMGPDSKPRNVLSLARGRETLYRVTPKRGGNSFVCNASHKLALKYRDDYKSIVEYKDIEVKDYIKRVGKLPNKRWYLYKTKDPITFSNQYSSGIDPYYIGLWLADGRCTEPSISVANNDIEILEYLKKFYTSMGLITKYKNIQRNSKDVYGAFSKGKTNPVMAEIRKLHLFKNKHVPIELKRMSVTDRLRLLAGYLDGDGCLSGRNKTTFMIETSNEQLRDGILDVAGSLGFSVSKRYRERYDKRTEKIYKSYGGSIGGNTSRIPTKLLRKKAIDSSNDWNIYRFTIEEIGEGEYYGFEVDEDHKFLLSDYLVTCNSGKTTCLALGLLYEIYLVTCMINPPKTMTGKASGNLVFAILSKDNATAVSQLGSDIYKGLSQAPYFNGIIRDKLSFSKLDKDGVQITDNILLKAGSSLGTVIGTDLYAGAIDEANMPSPRIALENLVEYRMRIYKEMLDRRSATLSRAPKLSGILWLTSSPTDEGDVLGERIAEVKGAGIPNVLIRDNIPRWEAREEGTDDTFQFFLGSDTKDPCIVDSDMILKPEEWERVIEVPNTTEYYNAFQVDPYRAIQNIAGRRTMPETALFNTVAVFDKVFHKENHIFTRNLLKLSTDMTLNVRDYLIDPTYFSHPDRPDCFRYIHLDMAYSCDKFGLASVYSDRIKYTSEDGHEIMRRKYFIDFCLGVTSPNHEKVDIVKVLEFIYSLKEQGYPLKLVTTDNHQGELARQLMAKKGVKTDYLSIEKDKNIYLNLKNAIITEALEGFVNPELMKELRGLRESQKKIEKGKGYTDDMSDALAGALWSCTQDRFFKKNNEAITEIIQQTGQMNREARINAMRPSFTGLSSQVNRGLPKGIPNLGFRYH